MQVELDLMFLLNFSRKLFFIKNDVEMFFFLKTDFKIGMRISLAFMIQSESKNFLILLASELEIVGTCI